MTRMASRSATDYLLVDISNSFTKMAFATRNRISRPFRLATKELTRIELQRRLGGRDVRALVVSSVVPEKNAAVRAAAGKRKIVWLGSRLKLGVDIDYPMPK